MNRLFASEVSLLCKILDEKVEEFLKRPIKEKIRYLLVDATYFKVGCGSPYKNRALLVVVGIREDGLREILGASIAESEDRIQKAVESSFVGASWQYCHVHFDRAVLESIPNKDKQEIADRLKDASDDEMKMQELAKELRDRGQ